MAASVLYSSVCVCICLFFLFFVSQTRPVLPGMNCWTFGRTHHKIFYRILIILTFCWTLQLAEQSGQMLQDAQTGEASRCARETFRMPLPSIHLASRCSLPNKTDELLLLFRTNKDFSNSAALCVTENWLNDAIPDSALNLPCFQLIRADRDAESTGKSHGSRTCFYINERRCTYVTVKEYVLFRSSNALHQMQTVLFTTGDLFVHSRECLLGLGDMVQKIITIISVDIDKYQMSNLYFAPKQKL